MTTKQYIVMFKDESVDQATVAKVLSSDRGKIVDGMLLEMNVDGEIIKAQPDEEKPDEVKPDETQAEQTPPKKQSS